MTIDAAIDNWARWHQQAMRWHRRSCKSLEHRYRSPQPWDAPPVTPLGRVDLLSAYAVEDAWKGLPFVPKMILKQWFVLRLRVSRICRSLRAKGYPVTEPDFDLEMARAKLMLGNALDNAKKNDEYERRIAVVCEPEARMGGLLSLQTQAA